MLYYSCQRSHRGKPDRSNRGRVVKSRNSGNRTLNPPTRPRMERSLSVSAHARVCGTARLEEGDISLCEAVSCYKLG